MKKKKGGGGGGANWMDTYGDMVTLLLCFFVLLYSMSTIDEAKWKAIVQSFNPSAIFSEDANLETGYEGPLSDPYDALGSAVDIEKAALEAEIEAIAQAMQELYETLQEYVEEKGMADNVSITAGDGYVFITFNDAVFFAGDSAVLLPLGQEVLTTVSGALDKAAEYIDEVRVMGHTAQAYPDRPNNPDVDRTLASQRATNAVVFIQQHSSLDPARLVSMGYGQHRPVAPNDSPENRAHNRRVEILITGRDLLNRLGDSIQQYESLRTGEASFLTEATEESLTAAAQANVSEAQAAGTEPDAEGGAPETEG